MSDGPNDMARAAREAAGERRFDPPPQAPPSIAALDAAAVSIGMADDSLVRAIRRQAGLIEAAQVVLSLAGSAISSLPGGAVGMVVAKRALELAAASTHKVSP